MHTKLRKSFTLIEMLIVIVIIGILAAALVPRLQDVQGRARDIKRKTDLKTISQALEIFRTDNGTYPVPANAVRSCTHNQDCFVHSSHDTGAWILMTGILTNIPYDPKNTLTVISVERGPWNTGNYVYAYGQTWQGGKTYDLNAQLENKNDPDRCGVRLYIYNVNLLLWCGSRSPMIYEYSPDSKSY